MCLITGLLSSLCTSFALSTGYWQGLSRGCSDAPSVSAKGVPLAAPRLTDSAMGQSPSRGWDVPDAVCCQCKQAVCIHVLFCVPVLLHLICFGTLGTPLHSDCFAKLYPFSYNIPSLDFSLQGITGKMYAFLEMTYSQTASQHVSNIANNQKGLNLLSVMCPC